MRGGERKKKRDGVEKNRRGEKKKVGERGGWFKDWTERDSENKRKG